LRKARGASNEEELAVRESEPPPLESPLDSLPPEAGRNHLLSGRLTEGRETLKNKKNLTYLKADRNLADKGVWVCGASTTDHNTTIVDF